MSVSLQSNTTICAQGPGGTFQLSTFEVAWRQLLPVGPTVRLYGAFVANVSGAPKADSKLVAQSKQQMCYAPGPTSSLALMLKHVMSRSSKEKNCRLALAWALRGDLFAPTGLLLVSSRYNPVCCSSSERSPSARQCCRARARTFTHVHWCASCHAEPCAHRVPVLVQPVFEGRRSH